MFDVDALRPVPSLPAALIAPEAEEPTSPITPEMIAAGSLAIALSLEADGPAPDHARAAELCYLQMLNLRPERLVR